MTSRSPFADAHDELRSVARDLLASQPDGDSLWRLAAEAGWLGLEVPEQLGGAGATFAETAIVLEELGRVGAPGPYLGAVTAVGAASLTVRGDERDALLAEVATGDRRVAVACTAELDSATPTIPFTVDAEGLLSGRADFVVDAAGADEILVCADSEAGAVLVRVPAADLVVIETPILDASRSVATVEATAVTVSDAAIWPFALDGVAAVASIHDRAALAVAIDAFGLGAGALEATVEYVKARHQFGRPVGSFQAVKHRCADMAVSLRVGRELIAAAIDSTSVTRSDSTVSRAKSFVTQAAVDIAGGSMQLHGGIGYTWESGVHATLKRAMFDRAAFGSPADHRRRMAEVLRRP